MQLSTLITAVTALALVAISSGYPAHASEASVHKTSSRLAPLVSALYAQYTEIAPPGALPPDGATSLAQASRESLLRTFTPDLAKAIWDDAQCANLRREICVIDFDLLYGSQDPTADDLSVGSGPTPLDAVVCFKESAETRRCITVTGRLVKGVPLIDDIWYSKHLSLRQMLIGQGTNHTP